MRELLLPIRITTDIESRIHISCCFHLHSSCCKSCSYWRTTLYTMRYGKGRNQNGTNYRQCICFGWYVALKWFNQFWFGGMSWKQFLFNKYLQSNEGDFCSNANLLFLFYIIHTASIDEFVWEFRYTSKISKGFILLFLKNHTREAKRGKRIQKERQMKFPFYTISMREYLTSHFSVSYNAQFKALSFICVILYKQPWIPVVLTNPI